MNKVFANYSKEDEMYPLTTVDVAKAQRADATLKHIFKHNAEIDKGLEIKLIENKTCVCKDGRLVIPKPLLFTYYLSTVRTLTKLVAQI
jgi:hypothetical protein